MQWATKAALSIAGVSGFAYSTHRWNEYYRQRQLEHPITGWLRQQMSSQAEDRQRRIHDLQIQSELAESRLQRLHKLLPKRFKESSGVVSNRAPVAQEVAWKSDF